MTDTLEFEIARKRVGLKNREVAKHLGISEMGLYKKCHNITEFKASELAKLYVLFRLETFAEQKRIFLLKMLNKNLQKRKKAMNDIQIINDKGVKHE